MNRRRSIGAAFLLATFAAIGSVGRTAPAETPLKIIVFPGGQAWPLWVGDERGFFVREGLAVETAYTPGSVFQMTKLIDGEFDIAITNIDNVIAYDEGLGEVAVAGTPDLFAFIGGNTGMLSLYATPEIGAYADLRGKALAVDAVTTGYAFVLREMLAQHGLGETDYRLVPVGGTAARWSALQQRQYAATMLNPHLMRWRRRLASGFWGMRTTCFTATRDWSDPHAGVGRPVTVTNSCASSVPIRPASNGCATALTRTRPSTCFGDACRAPQLTLLARRTARSSPALAVSTRIWRSMSTESGRCWRCAGSTVSRRRSWGRLRSTTTSPTTAAPSAVDVDGRGNRDFRLWQVYCCSEVVVCVERRLSCSTLKSSSFM